ncbi:putative CMP/dCMP-type deaminase domain-containing protein [Seiridium unicorne]|uniref:CMP/dCMP-type deaminase domain-containing protein n=1 Tax=Seiridium unicorne TaxID=138068 RepID=A0ABR2VAA4_9PEZI
MKTDNYKNLCLEQALLSPLKYRHGCIVVKGGKIIGRGFNDYRPGYDGGALKTGQLPTASFPRVFIHAAGNLKSQPQSANFMAFERVSGMRGGRLANTPLTMHSEMMAINSAVASSSTLAAKTVSCIKPCSKVLGDSKRKRLSRRDAVAAYVERVCRQELEQGVQQGTASLQGQQWHSPNKKRKEKKNKLHQKENQRHGQKKTNRNRCPPGIQVQKQQYEHHDTDLEGGQNRPIFEQPVVDTPQKDTKRSSSCNESPISFQSPNLPKGRAGTVGRSLQSRRKHPKLVGADLYVIRLSNCVSSEVQHLGAEPISCKGECESSGDPATADELSRAFPPCTTFSGSLHDELVCKTRQPQLLGPAPSGKSFNGKPAESRPCYRCVAYMDSVGIKRVFWTNSNGEWENAKVRDLVDLLDRPVDPDGNGSIGLFVTKHELLVRTVARVYGPVSGNINAQDLKQDPSVSPLYPASTVIFAQSYLRCIQTRLSEDTRQNDCHWYAGGLSGLFDFVLALIDINTQPLLVGTNSSTPVSGIASTKSESHGQFTIG